MASFKLLPGETDDFRVELHDDGVAHLVIGRAGEMPTTGAAGHGELGRTWPRLAGTRGVRAVLVRSEGKGFCTGGHVDLVRDLLGVAG